MKTKEIVKPDRDDLAESGKSAERSYLDVALIATLAPIVAAAIRIWLYSGGDATTFLVLLRTINIPSVLVGTSLLIIPYLLIFFTLALIFNPAAKNWVRWLLDRNKLFVTGVLPVAIMVIIFTVPWTIVLVALLACMIALVFKINRTSRMKRGLLKTKPRKRRPVLTDWFSVLFTVVFTFTVIQTNMWLPRERVEIKNNDIMTGYVLESTDTWTTVLTPEHSIDIVRTDDVESRTVCKSSKVGTLAMLIQNGGMKELKDCS